MKALALLLLMTTVGTVHADARIVTETYNPNRVYNVYTRVGRATLIQFEDDEVLSTPKGALGLGDSDAWELGVRSNSIILKPRAKLPDTNIVAVTNKRTYVFDLRTATRGVDPTYMMRFRYPDTEAAQAAEIAKRVELNKAAKSEDVTINTNYTWRGTDTALKPTAAYDDGRFTRLVYDHAGELPVFYKQLPDGSEALINSHIDKNEVVFHEVIRTAKARLGNSVIEIINRGYARPAFNQTGSGTHGAVRIDQGN